MRSQTVLSWVRVPNVLVTHGCLFACFLYLLTVGWYSVAVMHASSDCQVVVWFLLTWDSFWKADEDSAWERKEAPRRERERETADVQRTQHRHFFFALWTKQTDNRADNRLSHKALLSTLSFAHQECMRPTIRQNTTPIWTVRSN